MSYRERVVDALLRSRLESAGAVLIEGPKACGKTMTARQVARSEVLLDIDANAQAALDIDPGLVLGGATPRLIDEWQTSGDVLWNNVRRLVDERGVPGQFILTGSAVPADDVRRHTGAGRFSTLRMRPFSLYESGHSSGQISLADLLAEGRPSSSDPGITVPDLAELIAVGGWPANLSRTVTAAIEANQDYLTRIREIDVHRVGATRRDPQRLERFLRSLARNSATEASVTALSADAGGADGPLARTTSYDYLDVLERLMVIEDQPAWSTHLRSTATLRQAAKRHFTDPSLAVAALGATPERLPTDLNTFGCLFESLVVRDLRVLSQPTRGSVYHYRDSTGLEVDAIVQLPDGRWGAFEVKLGTGHVDAAAAALNKFAAQIDVSKAGKPAVLAVITGAGYGYVRPDGVVVVPVGALAP